MSGSDLEHHTDFLRTQKLARLSLRVKGAGLGTAGHRTRAVCWGYLGGCSGAGTGPEARMSLSPWALSYRPGRRPVLGSAVWLIQQPVTVRNRQLGWVQHKFQQFQFRKWQLK